MIHIRSFSFVVKTENVGLIPSLFLPLWWGKLCWPIWEVNHRWSFDTIKIFAERRSTCHAFEMKRNISPELQNTMNPLTNFQSSSVSAAAFLYNMFLPFTSSVVINSLHCVTIILTVVLPPPPVKEDIRAEVPRKRRSRSERESKHQHQQHQAHREGKKDSCIKTKDQI